MNRTSNGTPGDANSIIKAEAIAAHISIITVDKFTFTPGIRYEDIKLNSLNYGTNDVSRAGTTLALIIRPTYGSQVWNSL
jgi:Fe(3+) dicitrate transport protein